MSSSSPALEPWSGRTAYQPPSTHITAASALCNHGRRVRVPQVGVLLEELHPGFEEGTAPDQVSKVKTAEDYMATYCLTVSESPMTVSDRFGRVMATRGVS